MVEYHVIQCLWCCYWCSSVLYWRSAFPTITPSIQRPFIWKHKSASLQIYSITCLKRSLKKKTKIGFQDWLSLNAGQKYCRMLEHSAILSTFIELPFVFKTFVLSVFEWPLKTGFTVFMHVTSLYLKYVCIPFFQIKKGHWMPKLKCQIFGFYLFMLCLVGLWCLFHHIYLSFCQ